jgi:phosphoserine phosphatase
MPFGIYEDAREDGAYCMHLDPGDVLVLLTDGFYECQNASKDQFGTERVGDILMKNHEKSARGILNALLDSTRAFAANCPQMDDMSALIIKRLNEPSNG